MLKGRFILSVLFGALLCLQFAGCDSGFDMTDFKATDKNVAVLGDSIFDLSGVIQKKLHSLAGKTYEDYSMSGAKIAGVVSQWQRAIGYNKYLKTIVMDGGGNDILIGNESTCGSTVSLPAACEQLIDGAVDKAENVLDSMYLAGVGNVVYLGYYHVKGDKAKLNLAVDYGDQQISLACGSSRAHCWFVDPRADFAGKEATYIKSDNIHPTTTGSNVLAAKIWSTMVAKNVYR